VRDIAARAGVSVSDMYHYHASKQQMLVSILDHTMSDLLARARAARLKGRDPVARFSALVENAALFHTHRRELGFVGASEMRSLEPADRARIAEQRTTQQRLIDHEVKQAVRAGRFRSDHPHEAARVVVTMCTALPTWSRPGGPMALIGSPSSTSASLWTSWSRGRAPAAGLGDALERDVFAAPPLGSVWEGRPENMLCFTFRSTPPRSTISKHRPIAYLTRLIPWNR
jgi:AcrR family transcriptional regulator